MKGTLYHIAPPGFVTVAQACQALGMNRANFHAKGYADALDRWQVSQSTTLYRAQDVANMVRWRTVRRGMIALGHWPHNTPGVPTDGEFHTAVHEGYWDVDCPRCGGDGVGDPMGDKVWCPECEEKSPTMWFVCRFWAEDYYGVFPYETSEGCVFKSAIKAEADKECTRLNDEQALNYL